MSRLLSVASRRSIIPTLKARVGGNGGIGRQAVVVVGSWTREKGSDAVVSNTILPSPPAAVTGFRGVAKVCSELSKARLSALVVMTTSAGFLAAGGPIAWVPFTAVCAGTMLAAGSANTFNQIIERENDRRMKRTFMRPLPSGRVTKEFAMKWGVASAGMSCAILGLGTNGLTAALGMGNLALYALPYTLSKTRSEINTWIGAIVGAVPPMMGWAAATNCSLGALVSSPEAMLLASILFLWQFPHFFALAWVHRKDYARGGFQMIPCNDSTGMRTAELILRYSAYTTPLPIIAAATGVTGSMFALEGSLLNAYLLYLASKFHGHRSDENARKVFRCSLWYLPVLLTAFVFHNRNWAGVKEGVKGEAGRKGEEDEWNLIAKMRKQLSKVCVHEVMMQDKKATAGGLCPAVVVERGIDEAGQVLDKVKDQAAAKGGVVGIPLPSSSIATSTAPSSSSSSSSSK